MLDSGLSRDKANQFASSVYMKHSSFIRKTIRSRLKDQSQADDIFQKIFLHLLLNPILDDIEHIERHLYRAVVNCIAQNVQQAVRYQAQMGEYAATMGVVETEESSETVLIEAEETATVFTLIHKQLSHKEFTAIALYYRDSKSIQEIAVAMGVKTTSIKRYIARGTERLRNPAISQEILAAAG